MQVYIYHLCTMLSTVVDLRLLNKLPHFEVHGRGLHHTAPKIETRSTVTEWEPGLGSQISLSIALLIDVRMASG